MNGTTYEIKQTRTTTNIRRIDTGKRTAYLIWADAKLTVDRKHRALKLARLEYEAALDQLRASIQG